MKKTLFATLALLLIAGCTQEVTGLDRPTETRTITFEFTGTARFVQYAEWRVKDGISQYYLNKELPFTVEVPVDAAQLCVYLSKYSKDREASVAVYENGIYLGGCTCGEGEIDAMWIEE